MLATGCLNNFAVHPQKSVRSPSYCVYPGGEVCIRNVQVLTSDLFNYTCKHMIFSWNQLMERKKKRIPPVGGENRELLVKRFYPVQQQRSARCLRLLVYGSFNSARKAPSAESAEQTAARSRR